jgi:hypothetical protein
VGRAIEEAGIIALAAGANLAVILNPELLVVPGVIQGLYALDVAAVGAAASLISSELITGPATQINVRQSAAHRVVIYGETRVGGTQIYDVITGHQYNQVLAFAWGSCLGPIALYLDGKQVYFNTSDGYTQYTDGPGGVVASGGNANGNTYKDQFANKYNFGGLVYFNWNPGTASQTSFVALQSQNGSDWGLTDTVSGNASGYLKLTYDADQFPNGPPQVRVTWLGRNTIYDPRSSTYGYTNNAALVIADLLMNKEYGFGYAQSQINMSQLIAAANVSDEQIELAAGGTESAFTINGAFDTSSGPGDILSEFLDATGFRISEIGGQIYIWPAAFVSPVITLNEGQLLSAPEWSPNRSYKDLFNSVRGTYIAPNFPYSVIGNYYDRNGFDDNGNQEGTFDLQYEPTNYPPYACDPLHGYATNAYLTQDGGNLLTKNLSFQFVNSVGQAQRVAKINLLRNRFQGSGTLSFNMAAYQLQPNDTFLMSFPALSWTSKLLEVSSLKFTPKIDESGDNPPTFQINVGVSETDPSIYEWSTSEELTPLATNYAGTLSNGGQFVGPSALTLASGTSNAYVGADGVVYPRILASWTAPSTLTEIAQKIQVQWQPTTGWTYWTDAQEADVSNTSILISGVVAGHSYNVRIRSKGAGGQYSPWLTYTGYTVSNTYSNITSIGISPGLNANTLNNATIDSVVSGSTATVRVYGPGGVGTSFTQQLGSVTETLPAASFTGEAFTTLYYVGYNTGTNTYAIVTQANYATLTNNDANIVIGSVTTVTSTGTGGTSGGGTAPTPCTVRGTELDTPNGPISNEVLKARLDAGETVYLVSPDGPEQLIAAEWVKVTLYNSVNVEGRCFDCSEFHPFKVREAEEYRFLKDIPSGTEVLCADGYRLMTKTRVDATEPVEVLHVHMSGPTHLYSVQGVFSHNLIKAPV